jgi:AbrB family looped-hinge helix DNA binding protein
MKKDIEFKTIKVSLKGQIAIPSAMRKELKIRKGEELLLIRKGDRLLIEKSSKASKRFANEFNFLQRYSEEVARKLWENKKDEIWNKL